MWIYNGLKSLTLVNREKHFRFFSKYFLTYNTFIIMSWWHFQTRFATLSWPHDQAASQRLFHLQQIVLLFARAPVRAVYFAAARIDIYFAPVFCLSANLFSPCHIFLHVFPSAKYFHSAVAFICWTSIETDKCRHHSYEFCPKSVFFMELNFYQLLFICHHTHRPRTPLIQYMKI